VVDTHAHLGLCEPADEELIAGARSAGVNRILTVGLGEDSNPGVVELARAHEEVFAAVGRHPNSAGDFGDDEAEELERLAGADEVVAVGETGLDWYREGSLPDEQRRAFIAQIGIANRVGKPLVVHLRDRDGMDMAYREAFEILESEREGDVLLHCFSAAPDFAERAAANGWYCSFAGNVTYPKSEELREAAAVVPEDRILVETDSPYLAPQDFRGTPNEPANVIATAGKLAEVRGVPYDELERSVEANAARLFGW
jgi:TatD DNase family protein